MAKARCAFLMTAMSVVLVMSAAALPVWAAADKVLAEFKSKDGTHLETIPQKQNWLEGGSWLDDGNCLKDANDVCPGVYAPEPNPPLMPCYYQGWLDYDLEPGPDNSCLLGVGCLKSTERYNSPPSGIIEPIPAEACTYSEWIKFDDGIDLIQGAHRLTNNDSVIPGSPPFGATGFAKNSGYPVLRIVTGDGNLDTESLRVKDSGPINYRNQGRAKIFKTFTLSPGATSVTMVCKVAAGPRDGAHEFVRVQVFGRWFTFGVDGDINSPSYGRFTYGHHNDATGVFDGYAFGATDKVQVAQPKSINGEPALADGEFFTLRVIMKNDGTFKAHLNEKIDSPSTGSVGLIDPLPTTNEISLTPREGDETMWIDYIQLLEGDIVPACPKLVFDFNRDEKVDQDDINKFFLYATGPAASLQTWNGLSPDCKCFDVNKDRSIDLEDFAVWQQSPNITWGTPVTLLNGDFEGGSTGGIATGWTSYKRAAFPTVNYTIQIADPYEGLQFQQIQTSFVLDGGAGAYQIVTGCTSGVTYRIQGWFRTNSLFVRATVKCDPKGGTSYGNAIDLSPAANTTTKYWVRFSGTVTAQASTMTIFLDGQTYDARASGAKAVAFDDVVVTCTIPP